MLRPPSSASARLRRRPKASLRGSTPHWERSEPRSSSEIQRSRGPPGSWFRRPCHTRSCGTPARRRTPPSWSCSRRPRSRARTSRWRRSRSRVSHPLDPLFVAWIRRDPLSTYLSFVFRPAGRSRDVDDASGGAPSGLQLLPAGTGGSAGGSPRGVPERRRGRRASKEFGGESPPGLGRPCRPAYARCAPPGDPKDPRRSAVAC
jgi:hypothetical protein